MSLIENFPDWINIFLIAPLGFALMKIINHSSRITKIETTQTFYVDKVEKICRSNEELQKEVHELIGRLEYFKK